MLLFFTKAWLVIKKYWKLVALVLGAIVGLFLFRGRITSFADDYRKVKDVHDEEVKKIEQAHEEERLRKQQAAEKLEKTLKVVEEEYAANTEKLDKKKKKEVEVLVKEHGNDPNKLAEELQKVTGFKIILPSDD